MELGIHRDVDNTWAMASNLPVRFRQLAAHILGLALYRLRRGALPGHNGPKLHPVDVPGILGIGRDLCGEVIVVL